jgi:hypothetical protein
MEDKNGAGACFPEFRDSASDGGVTFSLMGGCAQL